jgi:hypothetical protein
MRKGSRLRSWGVPTMRVSFTPAPSLVGIPRNVRVSARIEVEVGVEVEVEVEVVGVFDMRRTVTRASSSDRRSGGGRSVAGGGLIRKLRAP